MNSITFNILLGAHLVSLIMGLGAVTFIDLMGWHCVRGRISLEFLVRVAHVTRVVVWVGWAGLVLSGIGLIVLKGYVDSLTAVKLFLVAMIGINGLELHALKDVASRMPDFRQMPTVYKYRAVAAACISQLGWWGAVLIGFVHNNWQHRIGWPASPWPAILALAATWLTLVVVGRGWLAHHRWRHASL